MVGRTCRKRALEFWQVAHQSGGDLQAERARQSLDGGDARNIPRASRIGKERDPRRRRHQFAQQLETLAVQLRGKRRHPLDIAARMRQEGDEIEIHVADERDFGVSREPRREELLNVLDGRLCIFNPFHAP